MPNISAPLTAPASIPTPAPTYLTVFINTLGQFCYMDSSRNVTVFSNPSSFITDVDASTITFDMGNLVGSNKHQVTITASRILAVSNITVGQPFMINITQGGAGSFTVTWFTTIKWANGGIAPTLTTTAGKTDSFGFLPTSAGNYIGYVLGRNI